MNKETMENNKVELAGVIISEPEFMYESYGENFYKMSLGVKRKSGAVDEIPLTISERLFDMEDRYSGNGAVFIKYPLGFIKQIWEFIKSLCCFCVVLLSKPFPL